MRLEKVGISLSILGMGISLIFYFIWKSIIEMLIGVSITIMFIILLKLFEKLEDDINNKGRLNKK